MNIPIVQGDDICWEGLNITVFFSRDPDEYTRQELEKIVMGWYNLGVYGAFGGVLHNMSNVWVEDNQAGFMVDMGSIEETALEYLFKAIEGLSEISEVKVDKIVLGTEDDE